MAFQPFGTSDDDSFRPSIDSTMNDSILGGDSSRGKMTGDLSQNLRQGLLSSSDFAPQAQAPVPPGFSPPRRGFASKRAEPMARLNSNSSEAPLSMRSFPIELEMPRSSEETEGSGNRYTVYHMEITTSLKSWTVLRRYKEFDALNQSILENLGDAKDVSLPKFPAKKMFPMSSTDKSVVEQRRAQFLEYMRGLLTNPSIFNLHMTPTTKALVNFLDHDGTLAMQVKCFLLESKVQQLTYAYRELQQSRELTEQLAVGQTRMIDQLQQRLEALENATHQHGGGQHTSAPYDMKERLTDDSQDSSILEENLHNASPRGSNSSGNRANTEQNKANPRLPTPPPATYAAAAAAASSAIKKHSAKTATTRTGASAANLQLPPPSNASSSRQRSLSSNSEESEPGGGSASFALSDNSNPSFLFRNSSSAIPSSLQTSLFQPGRSVSVGESMLRNPKADEIFSGVFANGGSGRMNASNSITIPSNAAKELIIARRHSSEDRRKATGSFGEQNSHMSMINDILSPSTPPSPTFAKHQATRSHSTTQPSNPWGGDNSHGLAFVSSPPQASSELLPASLVPQNADPTPVDRRAQELIAILQPSPEAILHRKRIVKYISKHIKQTLGAQCFPIGVYALKTYLPDDWLNLSAFLCQGQEQTWFIKVNEVLCKTSNSPQNPDTQDSHKISNVNFSNEGDNRAIRCTTDGVNVDLTANSIEELYQVAFMEECDILLGKDHLLKRSIVLLKAWWLYETRAFSGQTMLMSVSDFALSTMLLCSINKHHRKLHHPLQVLAMFFSQFSKLNWEKEVVTLGGVVEIGPGGGLGNPVVGPSEDTFIPAELVLRFQHRCAQSRIHANGRTSSTASVHTSVDGQGGDGGGPSLDAGGGDSDLISRGGSVKFDPRMRAAMFTCHSMNIQNPLDPGENLVHVKVSSRRANRFSQVLQAGAKNLQPVLAHLEKEQERGLAGGFNTSVALFDNFFSNAWSRFGQGWRPDIESAGGSSSPNNTAAGLEVVERVSERDSEELEQILRGDIFDSNLDVLKENLKFCSFLLEREITQSALKTLSQVVLEEKGPMPVGEIGKMLQEATANPSLSGVLKESFGGLKKFLEKFPEIFLISQDHPFNPHVYMRNNFTAEEQQLISKGSTEFLGTKTKKKTRRKGKGGGGGGGVDSPMPSMSGDTGPSRDLAFLQRQQRQQRNSYGGGGGRAASTGVLQPTANSFVPRSSSRA